MNFLEILEEASIAQEARKAVKEIEDYLNSINMYPDNRKYIQYVQKEIIKLSERYSRVSLILAGQTIRNRYNKNIGNVSYLTQYQMNKNPNQISENVQSKDLERLVSNESLSDFWKMYKKYRNSNVLARMIFLYHGKDLINFTSKELEYFVKRVEGRIRQHYKNYKGGILKTLSSIISRKGKNFDSDIYESKNSQFRVENVNPYLTQSQKYTQKHPNRNGHQHSMRRTTGNDIDRQGKKMVPAVRKDLKNPYSVNVVNKAQTGSKILTPIETKEISDNYNIDFDDRRVKTIKGKTNMILTPLKNGGWKLEHR